MFSALIGAALSNAEGNTGDGTLFAPSDASHSPPAAGSSNFSEISCFNFLTPERFHTIINRPLGESVPFECFDAYGHHWEALYSLWPTFGFIALFWALRRVCKAYLFPPVAKWFGIQGAAIPKFSYQGWLLLFYVTSTIYGLVTLIDKPWVSFPLGQSQSESIDGDFRTVAHNEIAWYYSYQIGFFVAELYAIFTEPKRSDFFEYFLHHVVTLYLMISSWAAYEHRIGSYVLIIHDIVDIFLCFAKMTHYMKVSDVVMVPTFVLFTSSYAFFRMFCLPVLSYRIFTNTLREHDNWATTGLGCVLGIVLQSLHIFWFYLILRIIWRKVILGVNEDVRSDDEGEEESSASPSSKTTRGNGNKKAGKHLKEE